MVEKSSYKSFQTSYTFKGAPNIIPQMILLNLNLSPEISTPVSLV